MRTGYGILHSLYLPIFFLGVNYIQAIAEVFVCLLFGVFVSWYFIFLVVVIHVFTISVYKRNQFAFKILFLQVLKYPSKSYIKK